MYSTKQIVLHPKILEGNNGRLRWPPRTPDSNPLDYSVWGCIKNLVYSNPLTTIEDMKSRVRTAFNSLTPDSLRSATHEIF